MIDGSCGANTKGLVKNLIVPLGFVVRMEKNVGMSFDKPGKFDWVSLMLLKLTSRSSTATAVSASNLTVPSAGLTAPVVA